MRFEPNELGYAERKDICIIPTCVLFDAVNKSLAGKGKTREELEHLISESKGVLPKL
jgi:hypothetical protein